VDTTRALVQQLKAFRQRLLNLDTRNQSLFLRRIVKKRAFDLLGPPAGARAQAAAAPAQAAVPGETAAAPREAGAPGRTAPPENAAPVAGEMGGAGAEAEAPARGIAPKLRPRLFEALVKGSGRALLVPDSDLSPAADRARASLKQLYRFANALYEEKGLQETYVGLAWVEGFLDEHTFVRGPLVLQPCALELARTGRAQGWYVTLDEAHPPELNTALAAAITKIRGTAFPPETPGRLEDAFASLRDAGVHDGAALHAALGGLVQALGLSIDTQPFDDALAIEPLGRADLEARERGRPRLVSHAAVGIFPQASSTLYEDFEEMIARAEGGELDQGIVDNLVDAPHGAPALPPETVDLDAVPDERINSVLPSDPSQDAVLVKAKEAECLVVRGPPGTGKSQVIVNLIADSLSRGERVLVCCQKRAALDVVERRLRGAGLADAAFLVHDGERDRPALYKKLHALLVGAAPAPPEPDSPRLAARIDDLVRQLKEVAEPAWADVHGTKPFHLYARARPGFRPAGVLGEVAALDDRALGDACERLRRAQPDALRFDRGALARRRSWAELGPLERQELARLLDELRQVPVPLARPADTWWVTRARTLLPAERALEGRWHRFLRPRWYAARRFVKRNADRFAGIPRGEWDAAVERGDRAFGIVRALGRFFAEEAMWEVRRNPDSLRELMAQVGAHFVAVQEHDRRRAQLPEAERDLLDACLAKLPPDADWADHALQEATLLWIDEAERRFPSLRGNPLARYEQLRKDLAAALAAKRAALAREIAARVRARQTTPSFPPDADVHPNRKAATDWNKLAYEVGKKRRIRPLRALMRDLNWPLRESTPCWLASPEVVSEAFPLERGLFDLVIFDEASQLDTERALPVLYRAKRAVIAGDEQQMPPTHWFEASRDEEEEGEGDVALAEAQRADSLLVAAKRIYGFHYLSWHYRSRYQELIEYSNHAFYDGALQVAANTGRAAAHAAIEWVRVEGTWDRQTNPVEVRRCVDLLHRLLAEDRDRGGSRSLGVISFNAPQMDAIKDEIERRREEDADFAALYGAADALDLDDRPFVKNLENVQGDERDVILLSVGYGPGPDGVFRRHFGVVNHQGGENFLNVAVTRARERVIAVCSFEPSQLAVETSAHIGPVRLKQYLLYARAVGARSPEETRHVLADVNPDLRVQAGGPRFESPFEEEVQRALAARGYEVDTQVGLSGYRIDLAVVDPKEPHRYCLGIECDGATFHSGRSVRERDVSRQLFLESRGWTIHRVWSRDWWLDREAEIRKVVERLPPAKDALKPPLTGGGQP
jgi:very-short-patch-repair endonuclease